MPLLIFPYGRQQSAVPDDSHPFAHHPVTKVRTDASGLLVILLPSGTDTRSLRSFWERRAQLLLNGDYYILLYPVPDGLAEFTARTDGSKPDEADLNAETIAAATSALIEQVQQLCADYPVRAGRMLLFAEGANGMIAYRCALTAQTPFHGFCIQNSHFHSAALPPLSNAAGSRFLLRQRSADPTAPLWMAQAAQKVLQAQGATAILEPADSTENVSGIGSEKFVLHAIGWLVQTRK